MNKQVVFIIATTDASNQDKIGLGQAQDKTHTCNPHIHRPSQPSPAQFQWQQETHKPPEAHNSTKTYTHRHTRHIHANTPTHT